MKLLSRDSVIALVLLLVAVGVVFVYRYNRQILGGEAADFKSCMSSAGHNVLLTYPEQCVTKGGKSFPNPEQLPGK